MLKAYSGNKPYIFISYAHKDSSKVNAILEKIINDGYRVWYDEGIEPSSLWDETIAGKIVKCSLFIALVTANYLNSDNCTNELRFSKKKNVDNLLVFLEKVELSDGLDMLTSGTQNIHKYSYADEKDFYEKLYQTPKIKESFDAPESSSENNMTEKHDTLGAKNARKYKATANNFYKNGDYINALKYYNLSAESYRHTYGENNPDTAKVYHTIGQLYYVMREYDNAILFYGKALEMFELINSHGPVSPSILAATSAGVAAGVVAGVVVGGAVAFPLVLGCTAPFINACKDKSQKDEYLSLFVHLGDAYKAKGDINKAKSYYDMATSLK